MKGGLACECVCVCVGCSLVKALQLPWKHNLACSCLQKYLLYTFQCVELNSEKYIKISSCAAVRCVASSSLYILTLSQFVPFINDTINFMILG